MLRLLMLAALPVAFSATAVCAQSNAVPPISARTTDFIAKAAATDAFERDAGRLAQKRGQSAEVRDFGAMMVKDHTMTTDKLRAVLTKDRLPKPAKSDTPNPTQAKMLTDLVNAPKGSFDKAYAHSQVVAHQLALAMLQEYAADGENPDLKKLAADTEPLVQHHLDMAQKLEAAAGGPPKALTRKQD